MTTQSKLLYEHLLELGAPELPKNHHYKFKVAPKILRYPSIDKTTLHDESDALICYIRKTWLFGLFFWTVQSRYLERHVKTNTWHYDNEEAFDQGILKEEDIDGSWHLAHMVILAQDCDKHWKLDQKRKAQEKEQKKNQKIDGSTHRIKYYLNKRLP